MVGCVVVPIGLGDMADALLTVGDAARGDAGIHVVLFRSAVPYVLLPLRVCSTCGGRIRRADKPPCHPKGERRAR